MQWIDEMEKVCCPDAKPEDNTLKLSDEDIKRVADTVVESMNKKPEPDSKPKEQSTELVDEQEELV